MLSRAIRSRFQTDKSVNIKEDLVHTGQHYDFEMSQIFFCQLDIDPPQCNLGVKAGTHGKMTGEMLARIETVLLKESPDMVVVYGDTNSTLAGALSAVKLGIPVAHIEAGLRSFNRRMPEEINRILTDRVSTLLFCPSTTAVENLNQEGIGSGIYQVGDIMLDTFLSFRETALKRSRVLEKHGLLPGEYCLATVHRQENTDDEGRLSHIFSALVELANDECPVVFPLHPRTRRALELCCGEQSSSSLILIPPANYLDMLALECQAQTILTDSGGVQKEAFYARVPCITLREETEWPETVSAGWNLLAGANKENILEAYHAVNAPSGGDTKDYYGTGNTSDLILDQLVLYSGSKRAA